MSGNQSDLTGLSAKPKLITRITSGSGTHVPTADMARCFVRLQAGGAGGWTSGSGGGAGAMVEFWCRIPIAGWAYAVGSGGAVAVAGGLTTFNSISAMFGRPGAAASTPGYGGFHHILAGNVNATAATILGASGLSGVSGGHGGYSGPGGRVGFPFCNDGTSTMWVTPASNYDNTNAQGNGSGGDSFFGFGGASGSAPAAGNYGAGGGANAAGLGGVIEVWDYGA